VLVTVETVVVVMLETMLCSFHSAK